MTDGTVIRDEAAGDTDAVRRLVADAFADAPHASGTEAAIVDRLRADGDMTISLIADEGPVLGSIVGHVAFSPVRIDGRTGWLGLGPLAVAPAHQGRGIGTDLVRTGLARAEALGAVGVVLVGDPNYYARFGFVGDTGLTYQDVPSAYVQALPLGGAPLPHGTLAYALAFGLA